MRKTQIFKYIHARAGVSIPLLRAWWPIVSECGEGAGENQQTVINHIVILNKAWANSVMAFQGLCHMYSGEQSGLVLVVRDELARYSDKHPEDGNV
jgi:hypothetical protein